jgi:hypothetical protein
MANPDPAGLVRIDRAAKRFAAAQGVAIERARHRLMLLGQKREIGMFVLAGTSGYERVPPWDLEHPIDWETGEIHRPGAGIAHLTERLAIAAVRYPALYLDESDLEALLKPPRPAPSPPAESREAATSGSGRPRHRPPMPEKDEARSQAFRRVYAYGLPKKSSSLVAELDSYFCRTRKPSPSTRTIERWIAEWWSELSDMIEPTAVEPTSNDRQN